MEGETGGLEWQTAMLEQAADARFRCAHQIFVLEVQHLAGEHRIPVIHERKVAAVVATEILEVVAEGLADRKVLLEAGEARVHGMPPGVDDGGLRQDGVDE